VAEAELDAVADGVCVIEAVLVTDEDGVFVAETVPESVAVAEAVVEAVLVLDAVTESEGVCEGETVSVAEGVLEGVVDRVYVPVREMDCVAEGVYDGVGVTVRDGEMDCVAEGVYDGVGETVRDGEDEGLAAIARALTLWFKTSATYTTPAASTITPVGPWNKALVPNPSLAPVNEPSTPPPAIVVTAPAGDIARMALLSSSATKTKPVELTPTPAGLLKRAFEPSALTNPPVTPSNAPPARVVVRPLGVIRRILLLPLSAT
jgi:hypothetical protein